MVEDFDEFDYILAMDADNLSNLKAMAPSNHKAEVVLFLPFDNQLSYSEVPDPYYGKGDGFETVLDLVTSAADAFLKHILHQHTL